MVRILPIYQAHGRTYQADTCAPLAAAVAAGQVRLGAMARGHYPGRRLPRHALAGVRTVGYWDAAAHQSWGLPWHRNEGIELMFVERGQAAFALEDRVYPLGPGGLTFTRPWQLHRVGDPCVTRGRLHWLILDVGVRRPHQTWRWPDWLVLTRADLRQFTEILRHNEQPVWQADADTHRAFAEIARAIDEDVEGSSASRLAVQINQLLISLLEMLRRRKPPLDRSLATTLRTVELFWADLCRSPERLAEPWTVGSMARQCGLGITRFTALSRQLTNRAPVQHLNQCRLESAARLLLDDGAMSVTQAALRCGFSSSQYFATAFRRQFGCSPRKYRAKVG
ncbi:MAG: AraC family transcriptional regulator [Planctomycetota bacterium]